jgi:hypothetical protein
MYIRGQFTVFFPQNQLFLSSNYLFYLDIILYTSKNKAFSFIPPFFHKVSHNRVYIFVYLVVSVIIFMVYLYQKVMGENFQKSSPKTVLAGIALVLITTISGCSQKKENEISLEIKNVQSTGSNGQYKVMGSTNLPKASRIAIAAVRYLRPANEQQTIDSNADLNINRSILDRQVIKVNEKGEWEANLNIWQVAANGSYQEVWQMNQGQTALTPESDVTFTATFDPGSQADITEKPSEKASNQKIEESQPQIQELEGKSLRFTNQGEKYVQTSLSQSVSLPIAKTTPPQQQTEDINGGWGDRYIIKPEAIASGTAPLPPTKSRQTTAPLTASEYLR